MNLFSLWEENERRPFLAVRTCGGFDRNRRFYVIGVDQGRAFGRMLSRSEEPAPMEAREICYRDASTEGWERYTPPAPPAPVPHYPAIVIDGYREKKYKVSSELFPDDRAAKLRFGEKFVKLAKHVPPVDLAPLPVDEEAF